MQISWDTITSRPIYKRQRATRGQGSRRRAIGGQGSELGAAESSQQRWVCSQLRQVAASYSCTDLCTGILVYNKVGFLNAYAKKLTH